MTTGATGQLGLALPVQGELSGTWGNTVNNGLTEYVNIAISGTLSFAGDGAITLANTTGDASATNLGATTAQYMAIRVTGTTTTKVITGPSYSKTYLVDNASSFPITFKAAGQTGVSIVAGEKAIVFYNSAASNADYVKVASSVADGVTSVAGTGTVNGISLSGTVTSTGSLTLGGTLTGVSLTSQVTGILPIANGGTGSTTANLTAGSGVTISGTWPNQTIAATGSGGTITGVTASSPLASSGGTAPNISFTGTLATANGGTGNANGTVAKLATTNFTIEESGGKLLIKYGATTVLSISSAGAVISASNVTAYGTP
jgi:hypothetical protein